MNAHANPHDHGPQPNARTGLAILATICFFPFGIPALAFSLKSKSAYAHGHLAEANRHAESAKRFIRYAGAGFLVMMMVVYSLQFAFFTTAEEVIPVPDVTPVSAP